MPTNPSSAQSDTSRHNGAYSGGPVTAEGKSRSSLNSVRHGLCGRTFFLLTDEDPTEFQSHEATWLAAWRPRDFAERNAALIAVRALWREMRADRLEADVLGELFAAGGIEDEGERQAAKAAGMKALGTVLRYRARIEREFAAAIRDLGELQQRRLAPSQTTRPKAARPSEPEPANRPVAAGVATNGGAGRTRAHPQSTPAPGLGGDGAPCGLAASQEAGLVRPSPIALGRLREVPTLQWEPIGWTGPPWWWVPAASSAATRHVS